tara:strand:- start:68 stop:2086 length:2019 start_codon:yes stop_codon:yes gene_type:complete
MNKDNRTSNMQEVSRLLTDVEVPARYIPQPAGSEDNNALFLVSRSGSHNEKISYPNLKKSVTDNVVTLTGDQLISGRKTFADETTFLSRTNINEIIDITETGDISGNVFVGESGLFERAGIGKCFTRREMIEDVFFNRPSGNGDWQSLSFGGGVKEPTHLFSNDFSGEQINLSTESESKNIYQPSGYYAAMVPEAHQNNFDKFLDDHNLFPDELHYEMGGAWVGIEFEKPFFYKGINIFPADDLNCAAEDFKVLGSNDGESWTTIHVESNLGTANYPPSSSGNLFELAEYTTNAYSHYRYVPTKIINSDQWKIKHFNLKGVKDVRMPFTENPTHTLHISGDSLFVGDVTISGNTFITGNNRVVGDSFFRGNINQTGDFTQSGDSTRFGDSYVSGTLDVTGDVNIYGDLLVTGNIGLDEYLYHNQDEDTYLRFTDSQITLSAGNETQIKIRESGAGDFISFTTSGQERARVLNDGRFAINNSEPLGQLSVTGDSYLERLYVTGCSGEWMQVLGSNDETISFSTAIMGGQDSYQVDFPKTFGSTPILSVSLQNDHGAPIIPHMISGVTATEYHILFSTFLDHDTYVLHTTARPSKSSQFRTLSQSFSTDLVAGKDLHHIDFLEPFSVPPVVSTTIETDKFFIPHMVSGVTETGYFVKFGANVPANYKIHTYAVR